MKLLHVLMGAARGGCERNCLMVCREITALHHEVLVIGGPGEMSAEFAAAGAEVTHLGLQKRSWLSIIKPVREHARQMSPSGVIIWHGLVELPQLLFALRDHPVPIIVHGGNPAHNMPRWVDWKFRLLGCLLPLSRLPTYACCSEFVSRSFERSKYLRRFPRVVIPNGVARMDGFLNEPRVILSRDTFIVGMLARLDAIKDHATLLCAFAEIAQSWPGARLELAGDGELRGALEAQARGLGISERVTFLGMVRDVYAVMQRWDLFAYATTENEGLGNALIEAMMLGLPCVATDVGPIHEVAGVPPSILLIPPHNASAMAKAIAQMIVDVNLRRKFGASAREYALQEFSSDVFARRYAELLRLQHTATPCRS